MQNWTEESEDSIVCPNCGIGWSVNDSQYEDHEKDEIYCNCPSCDCNFQIKCVSVTVIMASRIVSDADIAENELTKHEMWSKEERWKHQNKLNLSFS